MHLSMIDVTRIKNVSEEEEIIICGSQKKEIITPEEIAKNSGTINEEIVTSISSNIL